MAQYTTHQHLNTRKLEGNLGGKIGWEILAGKLGGKSWLEILSGNFQWVGLKPNRALGSGSPGGVGLSKDVNGLSTFTSVTNLL